MDLRVVDATHRFLKELKDIEDPEEKRRRIGHTFIDVFEDAARHVEGNVGFLVQGTLYPDVIELTSAKGGPSATIKTHHNVGGLRPNLPWKLIEPLRELFKDEVRQVGRELALPDEIVGRHPFPGPGLAIRVLGPVNEDRLDLLRRVDAIYLEEIRAAGLYDQIWQAFAVRLPFKSGGVMWRPAVISSFALDYRVSSSPHWFHAINVLWAVLTTALFALLACELAGPGVGLVTGLFFAVHPVHVEAVANVVGRAEMMAAAGYAAALLCVVRAERKPAYLAGVAAGAASAITSKEIAVTLPAAVLLILWARRADLRLAWRAVVAATVPIVAYFIIQGLVGIRTLYAGGLAVGLEHVGFLARAWAMVRLSLEWWRLFLLPAHLSADYSPGELTVSTALTFWHLVGLLIWIAAGVLAWRTRRTVPGIAIGLAGRVITLSPVPNIVFPTEILIAA